MVGFYPDCTTQDLERLRPITNKLMLDFQAQQIEKTIGLDPRDQMIVTMASLAQLNAVCERASKKSSTPRFVRTILSAVKIARSFGTGNLPPAEQK